MAISPKLLDIGRYNCTLGVGFGGQGIQLKQNRFARTHAFGDFQDGRHNDRHLVQMAISLKLLKLG